MRFLSLLLPGSLAAQNGISLNTDSIAASFYGMTEDIYIDEHLLENDDDNSQAISILNGAPRPSMVAWEDWPLLLSLAEVMPATRP